MKNLLNTDYSISEKNIILLNDNAGTFCNTDLDQNILYKELLKDIFKESVPVWEIKNYTQFKTESDSLHTMAYFLIYYLMPIQLSKSYKNSCKILSKQFHCGNTISHSILHMINTKI